MHVSFKLQYFGIFKVSRTQIYIRKNGPLTIVFVKNNFSGHLRPEELYLVSIYTVQKNKVLIEIFLVPTDSHEKLNLANLCGC